MTTEAAVRPYTCPQCGKQGGDAQTLQAPDGWLWLMRHPKMGGDRYCSKACLVAALGYHGQLHMEAS
jgi:hypothetical protein